MNENLRMENKMEGRLDHAAARLREKMEEKRIPEHMREALVSWLIEGYGLGGFLYALFSNDLYKTFSRADLQNLEAIPRYVKLLYMDFPVGSWGSEKAVESWSHTGGLRGINSRTK